MTDTPLGRLRHAAVTLTKLAGALALVFGIAGGWIWSRDAKIHAAWRAPHGLAWGMTEAEAAAVLPPLGREVDGDWTVVRVEPPLGIDRPAARLSLGFLPAAGLQRVRHVGPPLRDDPEAEAGRDAYAALREDWQARQLDLERGLATWRERERERARIEAALRRRSFEDPPEAAPGGAAGFYACLAAGACRMESWWRLPRPMFHNAPGAASAALRLVARDGRTGEVHEIRWGPDVDVHDLMPPLEG